MLRRRRLAALLGAVLVLAPVGTGAASAPDPRTGAALGDSYSAGEGSGPPYDAGTNVGRDRCHRSPLAWPRLLGVPAARHLACSGARIDSVTLPSVALAPDDRAQRDALAALVPPPTFVTLTLGGNDAGFAAIAARCVLGSCTARAAAGVRALPAVGVRLEGVYRAVAAAAPGARIVVVGYPAIVPVRPRAGRCPWLSRADARAVLRFTRRLDATIAAAAGRTGTEYVDVTTALRGHELCTGSPWVFPILDPPSLDARQGHPRPAGQAAIAARVAAVLGADPPPAGP